MNNTIQDLTRSAIIDGLAKLPESWRNLFVRMYAHQTPDLPYAEVVALIPEDKLDWALTPVENSIAKIAGAAKG